MLERLSILERNISELEKFRSKNELAEIKNDLQLQWIMRYGLFESIQIVIDGHLLFEIFLICVLLGNHGLPQIKHGLFAE